MVEVPGGSNCVSVPSWVRKNGCDVSELFTEYPVTSPLSLISSAYVPPMPWVPAPGASMVVNTCAGAIEPVPELEPPPQPVKPSASAHVANLCTHTLVERAHLWELMFRSPLNG